MNITIHEETFHLRCGELVRTYVTDEHRAVSNCHVKPVLEDSRADLKESRQRG